MTHIRGSGGNFYAWGNPKRMVPKQFWLPLNGEAQCQAREIIRKHGSIANLPLTVQDVPNGYGEMVRVVVQVGEVT